MTFLHAMATVVNGDVRTTRISELSHKEMSLIEDAVFQIGNARTAKEDFDNFSREAMNPDNTPMGRCDCATWAKEAEANFKEAQRKLAEIAGRCRVVA